jgi:hypothetical protein
MMRGLTVETAITKTDGQLLREYVQSKSADVLCLDPLNVRRLFGSALPVVLVEDTGWRPVNRHGG